MEDRGAVVRWEGWERQRRGEEMGEASICVDEGGEGRVSGEGRRRGRSGQTYVEKRGRW